MKLFWAPRTRASRLVWMLNETGVDYEHVRIDIYDEQSRSDPDFRRASPMGKVPALIDGDVAVAESAAICLYLADRYASGELAPALDAPSRGKFLYWMFFTPAVVEPAMAEKVGGHSAHRARNGWGDFDSMIATLESGLEGKKWLVDDRFSAADVMVGSAAAFLKMFKLLPESATISDYVDRCLAREAYRAALALEAEDAG